MNITYNYNKFNRKIYNYAICKYLYYVVYTISYSFSYFPSILDIIIGIELFSVTSAKADWCFGGAVLVYGIPENSISA